MPKCFVLNVSRLLALLHLQVYMGCFFFFYQPLTAYSARQIVVYIKS